MPGFDFCGGRDNAVGILSRMERDDGMGGANAVLCEVRGDASGNGRKTCNVAGAVCMESPCCMLFVRIEAKERAEFDVGESAYGLWNTLALLATAADRKWGGNGR